MLAGHRQRVEHRCGSRSKGRGRPEARRAGSDEDGDRRGRAGRRHHRKAELRIGCAGLFRPAPGDASGRGGSMKPPADRIAELFDRIESGPLAPVWISLVPREIALSRTRELSSDKPLFGVPFAVKDNIDVAGMPTTAGCPAFAYTPDRTAPLSSDCWTPARSSSAKQTWTSSPPAWWERVRRTAPAPAFSIRDTFPADRAPVPPSRWQADWSRSRSAPTRRARDAFRRRSTISSG